MCRHLAYLGAPRTLESLVVAAPHALYEQSWAPRRQRHGTVNVDGFGVGWYAARAAPVRYRRAQPIWTDASFASLAPTITTGCAVAAVRSATAGTSADEGAAAPFTHDRWLFSHNGRLHDWGRARAALLPSAADVPDTRVGVDSALLFGLALSHWQRGAPLGEGLASAADAVLAHGGGRLTMLAADGATAAAVVVGEPVHLRTDEDGVTVASEPDDDHPSWREVPDRTVVSVDGAGCRITPL
ncbi:MAG: ergothioneine biosynthesis protein EgtC [Nocardioidaceae bacterium]